MGGVGTAHSDEPMRCETAAQPGSYRWHRPRFEGRFPLARLPGSVWHAHHDLQPAQPLVEGRHLADDAGSAGRSGDRPDHRASTAQPPRRIAARGGKGGAQKQPIGRSRSGQTTKFHAAAATSGRLMAFDLTPGQMGYVRSAPGRIDKQPKAAQVLADTTYDSDKFRELLIAWGSTPVIKPNATRKSPTFRQGLLQGPQRHRAGLLALERPAPCRSTIRQTGQDLSCHGRTRHTLLVVNVIESGALRSGYRGSYGPTVAGVARTGQSRGNGGRRRISHPGLRDTPGASPLVPRNPIN